MSHPMKIATCCYCGMRAALVLDQTRHELSCSACGAPLHDMKMMPKAALAKPAAKPRSTFVQMARPKAHKPKKRNDYKTQKARRKPIRKTLKKRMRWGREVIEDLWDVVEDIFD